MQTNYTYCNNDIQNSGCSQRFCFSARAEPFQTCAPRQATYSPPPLLCTGCIKWIKALKAAKQNIFISSALREREQADSVLWTVTKSLDHLAKIKDGRLKSSEWIRSSSLSGFNAPPFVCFFRPTLAGSGALHVEGAIRLKRIKM